MYSAAPDAGRRLSFVMGPVCKPATHLRGAEMSAAERPVTMCEAFQRTAAIDPDAVALRTPGNTQTLTWREYAEQVQRVAAGLAGLGVRRGDTVSLMMANRVEFYPLEVGAQHVGATSFSVYNTLPAEQLTYVFDNAGTKVMICEEQYVDRIRASGAPIEHIICIDGHPEGTLSVTDLYAAADENFDFESTWRAVQPDDIVTLIYTSGTTGNPKGVEMTHTNLLFEGRAIDAVLGVEFGDRGTSYLPTAHIADRMCNLYIQEMFGTQITTVSDPRAIVAALPDVRPTVWGAVPRVWEKLKAGIEFTVGNETDEMKRAALQWAMSVADKRAAALLAGEPMSDDAAAEWAQADELVLSKLRERLGFGELRWAISGAAPIPRETLAFFAGIGIPIAEVWGMSELSCAATAYHPRELRLGTVGRLLPGLEGKIAEDGEYLVRGPLVMKGYRKEPAKTAEAIDAEGWLHTGDIFDVDADGFLRVVDRKKELIINAAGKNMSPANIENTILAACPMIGVMIVIGDGRPYNTALLVFDADSVGPYAAQHGLPDASPEALAANPEVIARIAAGVAEGNAKLARVEQIKRFRVLPTLWEPGGDEITLTMKLKRRPIKEKYAAEIEELYAADPGPNVHEPTAAPTAQPA
ncbi:fatty-acid--CoA ligase [Mycobacterium kubicae]|uniref:Fatty-acid--CoA ligase n=2 Tax=Mycobacterium kubicae TaxID=120959 RepID=A0ABQ1BM57_9MYCO|nr:fatty-acid--CoA ligase [Mycobacterium kubicae]